MYIPNKFLLVSFSFTIRLEIKTIPNESKNMYKHDEISGR